MQDKSKAMDWSHHRSAILLLVWGISLFSIVLMSSHGLGETITVDDDGGAEYEKIQDAINASKNGDTIRVWEGTYLENVLVDKSINLIGNGTDITTIDGGGEGDVVLITVDSVNMSGFRVTGSGEFSAGIMMESSHTTISNTNCTLNRQGILVEDSSNNSFTGNNLNDNGVGIYFSSSDSNILTDTTCTDNGWGIEFFQSGWNVCRGNTCSGNEYGIRMVSFECEDADYDRYHRLCRMRPSDFNSIENNLISSNQHGIFIEMSYNNSIIGNTITRNGNGILLDYQAIDNVANYNNIYGNTDFGINGSRNKYWTIDATNNWWGKESGPYHPTNNSGGRGDEVTDGVLFDPWLGKEEGSPDVDFFVAHYFDPDASISDSNDGVANGIIDIFYDDRIILIGNLSDYYHDKVVTFFWSWKCIETGFSEEGSGDTQIGIVGMDFLYPGMNGSEPIFPEYNSEPLNYEVTFGVRDGDQTNSVSYIVRVHPLAEYTFIKQFDFDLRILPASVRLIWRGFEEEAAPHESLVNESTPVFVFINETDNPLPPDKQPLFENKIVGKFYAISSVGVSFQNGEEGFLEAEVHLPFLISYLPVEGYQPALMEFISLKYFDELEERFVWIEGHHTIASDDVNFAVGTVEHFSTFAIIFDSIYGPPGTDLYISDFHITRNPVLNGQAAEAQVWIMNRGVLHAQDVEVRIYNEGILIANTTIPIIRGWNEDEVMVSAPLLTNFSDTFMDSETLNVEVVVNPRSFTDGKWHGTATLSRSYKVVRSLDVHEPEEKSPDTWLLTTLVTYLVVLFLALIVVIFIPNEYY